MAGGAQVIDASDDPLGVFRHAWDLVTKNQIAVLYRSADGNLCCIGFDGENDQRLREALVRFAQRISDPVMRAKMMPEAATIAL